MVDEGLPKEIAQVLRVLGVDATSVHEENARGMADVDMLRRLATEGTCLLTRNPAMWTVPHERAVLNELRVVFVVYPDKGDVLELVTKTVQNLKAMRAKEGMGPRRFMIRRQGLVEER